MMAKEAAEREVSVSVPLKKVEGVGIYNAIAAIYQEGKLYAQKANRNQAQSYNYTSEADFLALMRPQLAAHNIVVYPQYEVVSSSVFTTAKGTPMRQVLIKGRFQFVHAPTATGVMVETIGEGMDQQDKAPYKAMTGALKYAIRQLFLIETGDDPEKDESEPELMTPAPRSRFLLDFDEQKERLIGNNKAGFQRVLTKHGFGPAESIVDDHLLAMSKDAKHALIADLKAEPPF